jgi:hypothetical protein
VRTLGTVLQWLLWPIAVLWLWRSHRRQKPAHDTDQLVANGALEPEPESVEVGA